MQNKNTGSQTQTKRFPIKQELVMDVFFFLVDKAIYFVCPASCIDTLRVEGHMVG